MGGDHPDTETLLRRVVDIIGGAKSMPLSSSVMISRDEVLELLEEAVNRLPDELRQSRWLLKEREEFLTKVQAEADDILAAARVRAERMVQRTEIVREARLAARNTVQEARDQANSMKHEAEDYADQKLAAFEIVLERTLKTARAGREKLSVTGRAGASPEKMGRPAVSRATAVRAAAGSAPGALPRGVTPMVGRPSVS